MSKLKIYLNAYEARKIAQALTPCISTEATRYYLNGVCLDASDEGLIAVATDGHKLGKLKLQPITAEGEPDTLERSFSHILPTVAVKWLSAIKPDKNVKNPLLLVTIENGSVTFSLIAHNLTATFKLVDGTFPEWRRVVPSTDKEPDASFNASYMAEIGKAIKSASTQKRAGMQINIIDKSSPAIITCADTALLYILMPMGF